MTVLRLALKKLRLPLILLQWIGNLVVILLAFAWLQIPDSHVWEFVFSILCGTLLVVAFWALYGRTVVQVYRTETNAPVWQRFIVPLFIFVIGYFALLAIDTGRAHEGLLAGYWNSKLSAGMRAFFTYEHFIQWQDFSYDLLQWLLLGLLLPAAFLGTRLGLKSHTGKVYRRLFYWGIVIVAGLLGSYVTGLLVGWVPGQGATVEIASVIIRLGIAYTLDVLLWCFVLAVIGACIEQNHSSEEVTA